MATTRELIDDLEKNRLAAQQLFNIAAPGTFDVPTIVEQAIAEERPVPGTVTGGENPTVALGGALHGATAPLPNVTVGQTTPAKDSAPVPGAPKPVIPAPQVDTPETNSFYDMLLRNDAYRLANQEAFERNEKANRARTTIAAVTDALASLGNLVGTTQGAFSQPQTYQTPFVTEQVEADRARARALADRIQANDQTLRLAKAREDLTNGTYALRKELEEEKTRRAQMNNEAKADLETQKQEGRMELEKFKQGGRVSLKQMDIDYKQNKDEMQAALRQQGIRISAGRLSEMIRHNQTIEKIREKGGGGGVGGYETVIIRDEFGREIRRKRVPLGATVDLDDDPAPWTSTGDSEGESAPWMQ